MPNLGATLKNTIFAFSHTPGVHQARRAGKAVKSGIETLVGCSYAGVPVTLQDMAQEVRDTYHFGDRATRETMNAVQDTIVERLKSGKVLDLGNFL